MSRPDSQKENTCRATANVPTYVPVRRVPLQPPESQQLWKGQTVLEDAKKLIDLKVENDDCLALCYLQPGE